MSRIDELIKKKKAEGTNFSDEYEKESQRLEVAIALTQLRKELGLSQRELAEKSRKAAINDCKDREWINES
ncbi:hypothetical protein IGI44_003806 [Enterococcus sp. DIV0756]